MDLSIKIGNTTLPNPVGAASGTFGYGTEYSELTDTESIGAIYTKALTPLPKEGNPCPRLVETPSGLLNSIGLANIGVERFVKEKLPLIKDLPGCIIPNIAGSTKEDYIKVIQRLEDEAGVDGYEINLSCPNVSKGALAFGTDPVVIEDMVKSLRRLTLRPLIIKLTPNVTDISIPAKAAENAGADAVSCINTLKGMAIDVNAKRPVLPKGIAGLSGPAVKPVGIAMVYTVSKSISIPVIGIGGITDTSDALEYLLAGASGIQVGTSNFIDPRTCTEIVKGIRRYCNKEGIECIKDFHSYL